MILYFSGTGNSGYAARCIADGLGEPLLCLNDRIKAGDTAPVETGDPLQMTLSPLEKFCFAMLNLSKGWGLDCT